LCHWLRPVSAHPPYRFKTRQRKDRSLARISHRFDEKFARRVFAKNKAGSFRKKAYLLRADSTARKTLAVDDDGQSGFLKENDKTGLGFCFGEQPSQISFLSVCPAFWYNSFTSSFVQL